MEQEIHKKLPTFQGKDVKAKGTSFSVVSRLPGMETTLAYKIISRTVDSMPCVDSVRGDLSVPRSV
jgi:hypothetical protein